VKHFAVIGLGNFGSTVAGELKDLKCRVTAVDNDKATVQALVEKVDLAVLGDATDVRFLGNLEVDQFDCCIVSTGEDSHASILIVLHLRELGAKKIVVKANTHDHAKILQRVGATDTVIPEEQMAVRVAHSLAESNLIDYLPLTTDFCVAELAPPEKFVDQSLKDLRLPAKHAVQVIATKDRNTGEFNFVPGGDYRIKGGDLLVILGKRADIDKIND